MSCCPPPHIDGGVFVRDVHWFAVAYGRQVPSIVAGRFSCGSASKYTTILDVHTPCWHSRQAVHSRVWQNRVVFRNLSYSLCMRPRAAGTPRRVAVIRCSQKAIRDPFPACPRPALCRLDFTHRCKYVAHPVRADVQGVQCCTHKQHLCKLHKAVLRQPPPE